MQGVDPNQSVMVEIGSNLHAQLTRLNIAPSVKDWNSIARFLDKSKVLDKIDETSKKANDRSADKGICR